MSDELVYMYMYVLYNNAVYIVLEGSLHVYMHM